MNLVVSGPVDQSLREALFQLVRPMSLRTLHSRADRYEDITCAGATRLRVNEVCQAATVDHAYIDGGRSFADFRILAIDMDSTLITIECIDEIANLVGKGAEVAKITEAAMLGESMDFAQSLRQRVSLLAGTSLDTLRQVYDERLALTPGAAELLDYAAKCGIYRMLLSGGFDYFTDRLRSLLNLDAAYGNALESSDGRLTGRVVGPVVGPTEKARLLKQAMITRGSTAETTIVIGDGANDVEMMREASCSIAYRGKPLVRQAATHVIQFGTLGVVFDWYPLPRAFSANAWH